MIKLRDVFGRLTVKSAPVLSRLDKKKRHKCVCACGKTVYVAPVDLEAGRITSCGCVSEASP